MAIVIVSFEDTWLGINYSEIHKPILDQQFHSVCTFWRCTRRPRSTQSDTLTLRDRFVCIRISNAGCVFKILPFFHSIFRWKICVIWTEKILQSIFIVTGQTVRVNEVMLTIEFEKSLQLYGEWEWNFDMLSLDNNMENCNRFEGLLPFIDRSSNFYIKHWVQHIALWLSTIFAIYNFSSNARTGRRKHCKISNAMGAVRITHSVWWYPSASILAPIRVST